MNIAVIFAGGVGVRMNTKSLPKQFLELHGKPIIIYTLEHFEKHPDVDAIVVVCVEGWEAYLEKLLSKFDITKVKEIVTGGETGQDSIYKGLCAAESLSEEANVLIHDGVRPLIDSATISENIRLVKESGSCITCVPTTETFIIKNDRGSLDIPERAVSLVARAPQSFRLIDILTAHRKALNEGRHDFIDSCSLMNHYGYAMETMLGPTENIKITTPEDFFIFRAIQEVKENSQIFGY